MLRPRPARPSLHRQQPPFARIAQLQAFVDASRSCVALGSRATHGAGDRRNAWAAQCVRMVAVAGEADGRADVDGASFPLDGSPRSATATRAGPGRSIAGRLRRLAAPRRRVAAGGVPGVSTGRCFAPKGRQSADRAEPRHARESATSTASINGLRLRGSRAVARSRSWTLTLRRGSGHCQEWTPCARLGSSSDARWSCRTLRRRTGGA